MSLKLILGSAGSGKTQALLGEIIAEAQRFPDKNFIVIVPEQVTMQTQDRLTAMHPGGTILNIDVLSFQRLAYRVFAELGLKKKELLDETGKTFIIEKIALDLADDLPYLGRRMKASGSAAAMKSVISELMQYGIEKEDLEEAADRTPDRLLKAKLHDIARIYGTYLERLGEAFITAEEVPALLSEVVDQSELIRGSILAFDGFTGFTPVQERLVQKLLSAAERALVTVTYDSALPLDEVLEDDRLFAMSGRMIRSLMRMANEEAVRFEPAVRLGGAGLLAEASPGEADPAAEGAELPRFASSPELRFLENHLYRVTPEVYPGNVIRDIRLYAYSNPAEEAEGTAREIARLIRTKGWRYRDIGVVCGDLSAAAAPLKKAFAEADIPCFIDYKRPLLGNPFVEYIRAGVEAAAGGYSYDSVFRCLKSGMTDLTADEIDRLEDHVLGAGIRSKRAWRTPWTYLVGRETPDELEALNLIREKVCALLDPLSDAMAARGATVRERTAALYRFGTVSRCQEKLKGRQEAFEESGRLDLMREYAQIYGKVMALYDRLVELLGNETMPMADYQALLEAGLAEIRLGLVPPGTDQVMVGDVERSRLNHIKALFFVGVNEGSVPKSGTQGNFLTEADRARLVDSGLTLRPSPREEAYIQNFYLYLTLTKPSEQLVLSYVMADGSGSAARPSTLISLVKRLFPALEIQTGPKGFSTGDGADPAGNLEHPSAGLKILAESLRNRNGGAPSNDWYELYGWYRRHDAFRPRVAALLKGASYHMEPDAISRAAARRLYGRVIRGSATRLETYAACPFRYLMQYGLRLKEREEFSYTGIDRGNVIHETLERFGKTVIRERLSWADLSDEAMISLTERAVGEAVRDRPIFEDGARNAYEVERLKRMACRAVWAVREQLKAGDFVPHALEAGFADDLLASSRIPLKSGGEMILTGKIDRIDAFDEGEVSYVKVIDYKTGSETFSLTKLYHGLQLQLVLYMNAALEIAASGGRIAVPAGFFYHKVEDPMLTLSDIEGSDPERERLKALRENGFISSEPAVYTHFDRRLPIEGSSVVAPIRLTKSGEPYKKTSCGDREAFGILGTYAARKAAEIGEEILGGNASASPYRMGDETGCKYCPYRGICGFDERLPGCRYRVIRTMEPADAILRMKADNELDS